MSDLASAAIRIAARGAAEYLARHQIGVMADDLSPVLRRHVKAAIGPALRDAKDALDCNMGAIAEQTFAASMTLAGISAAKEIEAQGTLADRQLYATQQAE